MPAIFLSNISFSYNGIDAVLDNVSLSFRAPQRIAIVGDNGCGKTTLLRIISGHLVPGSGNVTGDASLYLLPQMLSGANGSGGERQMRALSYAFDSGADILLLDEPSNNLDAVARREFFERLRAWRGGVVIVSHDRELLNRMDVIIELSNGTARVYGGNYDFYRAMRDAQIQNLESRYIDAIKEIGRLARAKQVARTTMDKHVAKQHKDKVNARRSRLEGNALKGHSAETAGKKLAVINKKLTQQMQTRQELSTALRDDSVHVPLPSARFPNRELVVLDRGCFSYSAPVLTDFSLIIRGGDRVHISGRNGCGKTTLLRLIMGRLSPSCGTARTWGNIAYLDQDLSLLDKSKSVVDNIMDISGADKNGAHAIAANFGFRGALSSKRVGVLSGGELLKATLAALLGGDNQPELLILDEPTNNLDIKSMGILEDALNQYTGAILLVSHDKTFVQNLHNIQTIEL